jgi:hypothetical protein
MKKMGVASTEISKGIHCIARYLCDKPNGEEFCYIVNSDYEGCPHYKTENVMIMSPPEVHCSESVKCKFAGKRENCRNHGGNSLCLARTIEGIPDGLVEKIAKVIPAAR